MSFLANYTAEIITLVIVISLIPFIVKNERSKRNGNSLITERVRKMRR